MMADTAENPPLARVDRAAGFSPIKKWHRRGGAKTRRRGGFRRPVNGVI